MKAFYIIILLYSILLTDKSLCNNTTSTTKNTPNQHSQEVWITVFIHGIMSIKPHVNIENLIRLFYDRVDGSVYAKTINIMRKNPFFSKNQAMQACGLHPIDCHKQESGYASGALATIFDTLMAQTLRLPPKNYFYTFGWSGIISHTCRKKAGQKLYQEVADELALLKQIGIKPKIRIIGYSHGGNVALNSAFQYTNKETFAIDELILIGTPIQCENDYLVTSPFFKRVINIYSAADRIQCLDFFSKKRFFSKQVFTARTNLTLPANLTQIQVRTTTTVGHHDDPKNYQTVPVEHPAVISGQARFLRERSPGHAELWFFGWTPENYRTTYPLYPLPTVAILPFILNSLSKCPRSCKPEEILIADLRPEYKHLILRTEHNYSDYTIAPFLSTQDIRRFTTILEQYKPKQYSKKEYNYHVYEALKLAQKEHLKHNEMTQEKKKHTFSLSRINSDA